VCGLPVYSWEPLCQQGELFPGIDGTLDLAYVDEVISVSGRVEVEKAYVPESKFP